VASSPLPISRENHDKLVGVVKRLIERQNQFDEFYNKMQAMDEAYAGTISQADKDASEALDTPIETPLVVSQVDTVVSYLAEVYLSGYPIFGVVGDKETRAIGEQMETLIDSHAIKGKWGRHILRHFVDGAKYNVNALEVSWEPQVLLTVTNTDKVQTPTDTSFQLEYLNSVFCPDMYNLFWDYSVAPADVSEHGDYIGYNTVYSKLRLRRLTLKLGKAGTLMNAKKALESTFNNFGSYYRERPIVADYISSDVIGQVTDWIAFSQNTSPERSSINYTDKYLVSKLYIRITPADYDMITPNAKEPQIWKLRIVNLEYIISMERVYTPNDTLPILMGQYNEDGFSYQTKSVAEGILPWQDAASELLNIRLNGARRSISDRAIYDATFLNPTDVNSQSPAAKIPLKQSLRGIEKSIDQIYRSIPFESTGTNQALGDLQALISMAEYVYGFNSASQGAFRKGNRTLGEFEGVQEGSQNRARLIALRMEYQVFTPAKQHIKYNILQFQDKEDLLSLTTGQPVTIDPAAMRDAILEFKLADGFTPKSKLISVEAATVAFQTLQAVPALAAEYDMGELFAGIMSLMGFPGLEKYKLTQEQKQAQPQPQLDANGQPIGAPNNAI